MTAKEYLKSLRKTDAEIQAMKAEISKLRDEAEGIKAMSLSDMPRGGQLRDAATLIATAVDLQADCAERMAKLSADRQEALASVMCIDRTELRTLLILYYLVGKSWEQVADELNYSMRNIFKLHGVALCEFEKVWQ